MWAGLLMLLLLSIVMATASFLAGMLPLSLSLSSRQLRLITALGTGVLVGTALIVIIPEGVETLYKAGEGGHAHGHRVRNLARDGGLSDIGKLVTRDEIWTREALAQPYDTDNEFRTGPDDGFPGTGEDASIPNFGGSEPPSSKDPTKDHGATKEKDPHVWVGFALVSGFILMYLIDTLPSQAGPALQQQQPQRFAISLNQFSLNRLRTLSNGGGTSDDAYLDGDDNHSTSNTPASSSRTSSTTLGLVIHAAADGIALGASSTSSSSNLSFIIFIALMLHKAPAAFGLTSVLLKQGLSKRMARAHLVVFSLAAPVGALLTWSAINILGFSSSSSSSDGEFATGVLLLFSGGTFLYVAVHTMQETGNSRSGRHAHGGDENGYVSVENPYAPSSVSSVGATKAQTAGQGVVDIFVTVCGMLLPLLTQWGH